MDQNAYREKELQRYDMDYTMTGGKDGGGEGPEKQRVSFRRRVAMSVERVLVKFGRHNVKIKEVDSEERKTSQECSGLRRLCRKLKPSKDSPFKPKQPQQLTSVVPPSTDFESEPDHVYDIPAKYPQDSIHNPSPPGPRPAGSPFTAHRQQNLFPVQQPKWPDPAHVTQDCNNTISTHPQHNPYLQQHPQIQQHPQVQPHFPNPAPYQHPQVIQQPLSPTARPTAIDYEQWRREAAQPFPAIPERFSSRWRPRSRRTLGGGRLSACPSMDSRKTVWNPYDLPGPPRIRLFENMRELLRGREGGSRAPSVVGGGGSETKLAKTGSGNGLVRGVMPAAKASHATPAAPSPLNPSAQYRRGASEGVKANKNTNRSGGYDSAVSGLGPGSHTSTSPSAPAPSTSIVSQATEPTTFDSAVEIEGDDREDAKSIGTQGRYRRPTNNTNKNTKKPAAAAAAAAKRTAVEDDNSEEESTIMSSSMPSMQNLHSLHNLIPEAWWTNAMDQIVGEDDGAGPASSVSPSVAAGSSRAVGLRKGPVAGSAYA